ncbi:hypothetical protein ES703_12517 [subsurface metagenome]
MLDQENPTDAEIEKSIYTGVDCCRDAKHPKQAIRVSPSKAVIKPGGNVQLLGYYITRECDPACFHWRIIKGGGTLSETFGHATIFFAPFFVEACEGSAIVGLFCGGKLMDACSIGVNQYTRPYTAFITAGKFRDGASGVGTACVATPAHYPWVPNYTPKYSCIRVARRNCDGSARNFDALTVMAMMKKDQQNVWKPETDRFYSPTGILTKEAQGTIVRASFAECKQGALNARMHMWLGLWITAQDPEPSWETALKQCRAGLLLQPGGVLDVRHPRLIDEGCCPSEFI